MGAVASAGKADARVAATAFLTVDAAGDAAVAAARSVTAAPFGCCCSCCSWWSCSYRCW